MSRLYISDTKYRDIADGNRRHPMSYNRLSTVSDTKYRDIADGNAVRLADEVKAASQIPSTAI